MHIVRNFNKVTFSQIDGWNKTINVTMHNNMYTTTFTTPESSYKVSDSFVVKQTTHSVEKFIKADGGEVIEYSATALFKTATPTWGPGFTSPNGLTRTTSTSKGPQHHEEAIKIGLVEIIQICEAVEQALEGTWNDTDHDVRDLTQEQVSSILLTSHEASENMELSGELPFSAE